ncbi:MAG: formylglycine-generating enzyme family protein [Methylococcales bacterium]|jgi:formylglycine-generating enzyme required for sulfatase activity|nr:formylglycine-generating enzyme family protein [Methylococcales bacterium]MBT7410171.1 formylglycine-generating enzyme family protein [Methylococcales bacterium]
MHKHLIFALTLSFIFSATPLLAQNKQQWTEANSGIRFVWINSGCYLKGSPANEKGRYPHEQQRKVCIEQGFWMSQFEITQAQWQQQMGFNPSYFKHCGDLCPVDNISWDDALSFINQLNKKSKYHRFRLPSDDEWEYVARANTQTIYSFGNNDALLKKHAWYHVNSDNEARQGGLRAPNQWGLYDIYGNVWEWVCLTSPCLNSQSDGQPRALRGGSFTNGPRQLRAAHRIMRWPNQQYPDQGLRLIMNMTIKSQKPK